jgi:hypothetical protein
VVRDTVADPALLVEGVGGVEGFRSHPLMKTAPPKATASMKIRE